MTYGFAAQHEVQQGSRTEFGSFIEGSTLGSHLPVQPRATPKTLEKLDIHNYMELIAALLSRYFDIVDARDNLYAYEVWLLFQLIAASRRSCHVRTFCKVSIPMANEVLSQ